MPVIEIEVDAANNADLMFEPAQERVRGRFLAHRVKLDSAGRLAMALPDGLPGGRIRIDTAAGVGALVEPLAGAAHAGTREALAKLTRGETATAADLSFPPAVRDYPNAHAPTWVAWMVRAVRAGLARVVSGALPDAPPADAKPRVFSALSQAGAAPAKDDKDATIERLTALLVAKLTPAEKKELGLK